MRQFNRKIKYALLITLLFLVAFISFSKAGILFSDNSKDVITVSTTKKTFEPNNYVLLSASVSGVNDVKEEVKATTSQEIKTTTTTTVTTTTVATTVKSWDGPVLSKSKGTIIGPSGKETYYNLNMDKIVVAMRNMGFSETEYPYWIREDGVKMLGNYVMVAANYEIRPKGSFVESSLGTAIVCDTGGFAKNNPTQIDVAVNWR